MSCYGKIAALACVALAALPTYAKEKKTDPLKDTVKQINTALAKGDAAVAQDAFGRVARLKENYSPKKFAPAVKAVAKGVGHKDPVIMMAAIQALGTLKAPGSAKALGKFLNPPAKLGDDRVRFYVAALASAGSIHDTQSLKALEKAVAHTNPEIAAAAGRAFGGYGTLDPKPKSALVKKLIKTLAGLEKKATAARDEEVKGSAAAAAGAINESLAGLTGKTGVTSAKGWTAWLSEQAKNDS